jgi:plastocyanin
MAALGAAFVVVTAILALTASAGSGGATASSGGAPAATGDSVTIQGFAYQAVNLQVKVGTKVTWTNQDSRAHGHGRRWVDL